MVVEGDVACWLVDRKHFGVFDEFATSSQMSIHWLVNPGSMFIHSDFHAAICLPNILFSASWTLNLIDGVDLCSSGAEKAQVLALVTNDDPCVLLQVSPQLTCETFDEGFAFGACIRHVQPDGRHIRLFFRIRIQLRLKRWIVLVLD